MADRLKAFQATLKGMFEQIEPQFLELMISDFKGMALRQGAAWETRKEQPWPDESNMQWRQRDDLRRKAHPGKYVKLAKDPNNDSVLLNLRDNAQWWEHIKLIKHTINYKLAEDDATAIVRSAKEHFIVKQSQKLANACARHTKAPKLGGSLTIGNPITGRIEVSFSAKDSFALNMSIIVNHRYNRMKDDYTYFNQFPSRFSDVIKGGEPVKNPSEAWMQANF